MLQENLKIIFDIKLLIKKIYIFKYYKKMYEYTSYLKKNRNAILFSCKIFLHIEWYTSVWIVLHLFNVTQI